MIRPREAQCTVVPGTIGIEGSEPNPKAGVTIECTRATIDTAMDATDADVRPVRGGPVRGGPDTLGAARLKVAIIHDWLDTWAGSERVLAELLGIFPQSDLYAIVEFMPSDDRKRIPRSRIETSFIQRLPFARQHFRKLLALMPFAVEQFDLRGYDLVISSCHAASKSAITGPDQLHVCMCYTPPRYAWDMQPEYLEKSGLGRGLKGWMVRRMLHRFRLVDLAASARVDRFVAISHYVARRIAKCYRRDSDVIYPPVDIAAEWTPIERGNDFVTVSRIVPYKRVDLLVETFARLPERTLHVVGDGPDFDALRSIATPNVVFHGRLDDDARDRLVASSAAFLFAAEEDFGISPLEAQALGTPVIAFGRGGSSETIRGLESGAPTGVFFDSQTPDAVVAAIHAFDAARSRITPQACRDNALRFGTPRFRREFADYIDRAWATFSSARAAGTSPRPEPRTAP